MHSLRVCMLQMDIHIGEPKLNYAKVNELLEQAIQSPEKPDVILLPEMWNTGYALDHVAFLADSEGEETKQSMSWFSRTHHVNIIAGSISQKKVDQVYNTVYIFNRQGILTADYSKIHLFRLMDEDKYLTSGNKIGQCEIDGVKAGVMICYDIRFPELARTIALEGAKILYVPAEWPAPRMHHWRTLLMARAIENQMFVVACNRVGTSNKTDFFGHSMIIDPWGEIVAEGGEETEIISATIDLSQVEIVRNKIPVFADRCPHLY